MNISAIDSAAKILLVIDSSPHSAAAVDLLAHVMWPVRTSAEVLVLVPERLPCMDSPPEAASAPDETVQLARWRDWAAAKLLATQVANQLQAHHVWVTTEICEGQPARTALDRIPDRAPDLIVIGAKGTGTAGQVGLDPVIYELADRANCSVLIVRPSLRVRPLSTILAVHGCPQTWRIIEFLSILSLPNWARVTVVSVTEERASISAAKGAINDGLSPDLQPIAQSAILAPPELSEAEICTREVISRLRSYGVRSQGLTCFGHPANEILNAAAQRDVALIVIGAGSQICPESSRLGSVAGRVLKEAASSVLVVR
jgi:nucleotide-binding universal stress UspA family protein